MCIYMYICIYAYALFYLLLLIIPVTASFFLADSLHPKQIFIPASCHMYFITPFDYLLLFKIFHTYYRSLSKCMPSQHTYTQTCAHAHEELCSKSSNCHNHSCKHLNKIPWSIYTTLFFISTCRYTSQLASHWLL